MEIEEAEGLKQELVNADKTKLYIALVRYGASHWTAGPTSKDKEAVLTSLEGYAGVTAVRIYHVDDLPNFTGAIPPQV